MEAEVVVRCRKSDEKLVQEIIEPAIEEYKSIMKREVKVFQNRDVPCKVTIDKARSLAEYDANE
jgi:hypothetical protein